MATSDSTPSTPRPVMRPENSSVRVGFPVHPLTDLYYYMLKASWTAVLGMFAVIYLLTNVVFAGLYLAGGDCIEGARPGSFADAFYFSVQSIATIGYGGLLPRTGYAHMLVTLESMVGIIGVALATGIAFAKFGRPRANMAFSNNVIIAPYDGARSLYFRVANIRGNDVVEATVTIAVIMSHVTAEGHSLRQVHELELVRSRTPLFRLTWLVIHVIDETSPLWGMEAEDFARERTIMIVSLTGMDGTFAQAVNVRHVYLPQDLLFDHHFEDIIADLDDGRIEVDFNKFHLTRPLTPEQLAAGARVELEDQDSELLDAEVDDACVSQDCEPRPSPLGTAE